MEKLLIAFRWEMTMGLGKPVEPEEWTCRKPTKRRESAKGKKRGRVESESEFKPIPPPVLSTPLQPPKKLLRYPKRKTHDKSRQILLLLLTNPPLPLQSHLLRPRPLLRGVHLPSRDRYELNFDAFFQERESFGGDGLVGWSDDENGGADGGEEMGDGGGGVVDSATRERVLVSKEVEKRPWESMGREREGRTR